MLATLAADPIAGLVDTAYMGRLGGRVVVVVVGGGGGGGGGGGWRVRPGRSLMQMV